MSSKRKAPDAADPAHKAAEDPTPNKKKASKSQGRMHRGALCEASASTGAGRRKRVLCEHGRRKGQCKDCGGSSFCEHKRRKGRCKDCGGSSFCEHNRRKGTCKDCGGGDAAHPSKAKTAKPAVSAPVGEVAFEPAHIVPVPSPHEEPPGWQKFLEASTGKYFHVNHELKAAVPAEVYEQRFAAEREAAANAKTTVDEVSLPSSLQQVARTSVCVSV